MTIQYQCAAALLPQGWAEDVLMTVDDDGLVTAIETSRERGTAAARAAGDARLAGHAGGVAKPVVKTIPGIVVPGMPNAHSHAFQRGMAGNAEYRLSATDSFWTWRNAMYALAARIEPEELRLIASQLFVEMLKAGYTSVAEFHYLHRRPDGAMYDEAGGGMPLWEAIDAAANDVGIGLTLLPTLYQSGDFGGRPLGPDQARFALSTERFLEAIGRRLAAERRDPSPARRTAAAFHSLRAVPLPVLRDAVAALRAIDPTLPLHIHIAEQTKEVEACLAHTGRRPIELLLETGLLDEHWCLVHATHTTPAELTGIAAARAAVCVSITTEANLGDGRFDAPHFLAAGGALCVGSDSQATVCPAEELRWMEYQHRLQAHRRGVLAAEGQPHVGTRLWSAAAACGGRALGHTGGTIDVGARADWLVLDANHPSLAGAPLECVLDHLVFAGGRAAIRDVIVAGRWVVEDRRHALEESIATPFSALLRRFAAP